MSLDLTRTHFDQRLEFAIETGEEITQLGMCLISRMESGGVVTKPIPVKSSSALRSH